MCPNWGDKERNKKAEGTQGTSANAPSLVKRVPGKDTAIQCQMCSVIYFEIFHSAKYLTPTKQTS